MKSGIMKIRTQFSIFDRYLNSDDYKTSPMKNIQDQLKTFLINHHYYEVAIPLIRQFSKSYDHYYKKTNGGK